jgi:hypothetical protein
MTELTPLTPEQIDRITGQSDPYLSCDDCFEQTDTAVEEALRPHGWLSESFRIHVLSCPACHDDATSLAELIADDFDLSPAQAVARLEAALSGRAS